MTRRAPYGSDAISATSFAEILPSRKNMRNDVTASLYWRGRQKTVKSKQSRHIVHLVDYRARRHPPIIM